MDTETSKKQLGQYLIEKKLISPGQLHVALEEQRKTGLYLRQIFLNLGYVQEEDILKFFEEELNVPHVNLTEYQIDDGIIKLVPERLARRFRVIPLFAIRDHLTVAIEDPLDVTAVKELESETGMEIDVCIATQSGLDAALALWYGETG